MSEDLTDIEKILGGKLERRDARIVPGLHHVVDGQMAIYYQDDGKTSQKLLFRTLLDGVTERSAKFGGRISDPCTIRAPDGTLFRAMICRGDMEGWRRDVEAGTRALGLLIASIDGENFKICDGRQFSLRDCVIMFD
jgi:hypothetical protein